MKINKQNIDRLKFDNAVILVGYIGYYLLFSSNSFLILARKISDKEFEIVRIKRYKYHIKKITKEEAFFFKEKPHSIPLNTPIRIISAIQSISERNFPAIFFEFDKTLYLYNIKSGETKNIDFIIAKEDREQ